MKEKAITFALTVAAVIVGIYLAPKIIKA